MGATSLLSTGTEGGLSVTTRTAGGARPSATANWALAWASTFPDGPTTRADTSAPGGPVRR